MGQPSRSDTSCMDKQRILYLRQVVPVRAAGRDDAGDESLLPPTTDGSRAHGKVVGERLCGHESALSFG